MEKGKKTAKIRAEAIKIAKEKQKVLNNPASRFTSEVKAEIMKAAIAEAGKNTKDIAMVDGKIEVTPEKYAIIEDTCNKCAILTSLLDLWQRG